MSWQRILESARKNGFPIIVTDIAGREPMVVMPFDAFEEMNEAYHAALENWDEGEEGIEYSDLPPVTEDVYAPPPESVDHAHQANEHEAPSSRMSEGEVRPEAGSESDVSHLSMEDRFYLEPVDDDA